MEKEGFQKNIFLFYLITLFGGLAFIYDLILVIYYQSFGLSFFQISLVLTITSIFTLIFEIPSGAFADLYGKKKSLLIGSFAFFLSFLIILLSQNFISFLLAGSILGASFAFNSGAESALIYDSLKKIGRKKEYLGIKARLSVIFFSTTLITLFFGPNLYSISKFIPIFLTAFFGLFSFIFTLFLHEPKQLSKTKSETFIKRHIIQMKQGFSYILDHYKIVWLVLFSVSFYIFCNLIGTFLEVPYLLDLNFTLKQISFIYIVGLLIQIFISKNTEKFEKKLGENNSILMIALLSGISLFLTMFFSSYLISIFLGLFWGIATFRELVVDNYLNKHLKQENRATILSINSMLLSLITVLIFPLIGLFTDKYSTLFSIALISLSSIVFGLLLYFVKIKNKF